MSESSLLSRFVTALIIPFLLGSTSASADEKGLYHEVTPVAVFWSGDALRSFVGGGLQYSLHFCRTYWVGADFMGGKLSLDNNSGTDLEPGDRFLGVNGALYFNLPALLGTSEAEPGGIVADLYSSIGGGRLWLGSKAPWFGFVGGGMVLHTGLPWLAFRFDLKGYFFRLRNAMGSDFNADMSFSFGPSLTL